MPKRKHTELNLSPDGPWVTLQGKTASLTFSLRGLIRDLMPAQSVAGRRRIMAEWLRAREAEGKPGPVKDPPKANERKPIPASRRIPGRTAKR